MRPSIARLLLVMGFGLGFISSPLFADQRVNGYCMQGAQQVTINPGLKSTSRVQGSFPRCTVEVFNAGTLVHPAGGLFSDNGVTPLGNPFTADANGFWFFYTANGRYDIKLSGGNNGGFPAPFTLGDVLLSDPASPSAAQWVNISGNPFNDIRSYGAVCDGTDQNTAVQAAIAAGAKMIFIPAGCTWIAPGGVIPGGTNGLVYRGENWITSIIKSAANPATATLKYQAGVQLISLNLQGNTVNSPTNCPIGYAINASTGTQNIISTCYSSFDSFSGQDNIDRTGAFFKVGGFATGDSGDAANFSNCVGASGVPVNMTTGGCLNTGNALRADTYAGQAGLAAILATAMPGAVNGQAIISTVNNTGGGVAQSPIHIAMFDIYRTVAPMLQANQRSTTYSGNTIELDMADVSGTFNGNFLSLNNGGVNKLVVDSTGAIGPNVATPGNVTATGSLINTPGTLTLVNGANQNVATDSHGIFTTAGPTAGYAIGGLTGGVNGRQITIVESAGQILTINNQDAGSAVANRVFIPSGANYVCPHVFCSVDLFYQGSQWHLKGSN